MARQTTVYEARRPGADGEITLGLLADPNLPHQVAKAVARRLRPELEQHFHIPARWNLAVECDRFPADECGPEVGEAARERKKDEGWDLVVCVTDLPRHDGRRPVIVDVDIDGGIALVSLPALGAMSLKNRTLRGLLRVVAELLSRGSSAPSISGAERVDPEEQGVDVRFIARGPRAYLRLFAGMVRANRPWSLARRLYKVLVAALGTGAYVIVNQGIWMLSSSLDVLRLSLSTLVSIGLMVAWIIADHDLWEKSDGLFPRSRTRLYNAVTVATLTIGIAVLYVALFFVLLMGASFVIDIELMRQVTGPTVDGASYLRLAWLGASMATIAGALGSSLENDDEIREAAYGYRQRARMERHHESRKDGRTDRRNSHRANGSS